MNAAEALNGYVGLPYRPHGRDRSGVDCYGLIVLAYREILGKRLPDWAADPGDAREVAQIITANLAGEIQADRAHVTDQPDDMDIALVKSARYAHHVGLWFAGGVLHAPSSGAVCWDSLSRFRMIYGQTVFYKWQL